MPVGSSTAHVDSWRAESSSDLNRDAALEVVTEYVMLHLGRSKWRLRKWEAAGAAAGGAGAEGANLPPASDGSSSSSSSVSDSSDSEEEEEEVEAYENEGAEARVTAAPSEAGSWKGVLAAEVAPAAPSPPIGETQRDEPPSEKRPPPAVDPNEIDLEDEVEGGDATRGRADQPSAGALGAAAPPQEAAAASAAAAPGDLAGTADAAATESLLVTRRPDDAMACLPTRLASARNTDSAIQHPVIPTQALRAAGCIPWHGTISCAEPLDCTDPKSVGRWGEALVHNYLKATLPPSQAATWTNQFEETRAPYDLTVGAVGQAAHRGGGGSCTFIEVKTTRYADHNVFDLSYNEWAFMASEPPVRYQIYRVSGAGDPRGGARITIIERPLDLVKEGSVRLCMAV